MVSGAGNPRLKPWASLEPSLRDRKCPIPTRLAADRLGLKFAAEPPDEEQRPALAGREAKAASCRRSPRCGAALDCGDMSPLFLHASQGDGGSEPYCCNHWSGTGARYNAPESWLRRVLRRRFELPLLADATGVGDPSRRAGGHR